ncbi:hypothetical protein ABTE96_22620, partial [Acinetobacter baumannii]
SLHMSYSGQILSVLDTVGLNTTENQKLLNEHAPHSFKLLQALGVLRASDILSEENVVLLLNNPANSWHLAGILVALNQH